MKCWARVLEWCSLYDEILQIKHNFKNNWIGNHDLISIVKHLLLKLCVYVFNFCSRLFILPIKIKITSTCIALCMEQNTKYCSLNQCERISSNFRKFQASTTTLNFRCGKSTSSTLIWRARTSSDHAMFSSSRISSSRAARTGSSGSWPIREELQTDQLTWLSQWEHPCWHKTLLRRRKVYCKQGFGSGSGHFCRSWKITD